MQRKVLGRMLTLVLVAGVAIGLAGAWLPAKPSPVMLQGTAPPLPECPHRFDTLPLPHSNAMYTGGDLTLPGEITNVPEFHDCQRFMVDSSGTLVYRQLVAIFASLRLPALMDSLCTVSVSATTAAAPAPENRDRRTGADPPRPGAKEPVQARPSAREWLCARTTQRAGASAPTRFPVSAGGPPTAQQAAGPAIAAAEIFNFDDTYGPLGIGPAFNCLFVYFDRAARLRAKMVTFGNTEPDCRKNIDPDATPGKSLTVRLTFGGIVGGDYPPVARWDWDGKNNEQYIGIKCGPAWCEIGDTGFHSSNSYLPGPGMGSWKKVFRIKGWYDEQYLAVASGTAPTTKPKPSAIKATFVPTPDLDSHANSAVFDGRWTQIGVIMINGDPGAYASKLNVSVTPPGQPLNKIFLCRGSQTVCGASPVDPCDPPPSDVRPGDVRMWWARVQSGTGTVKDFCVHRRGHEPKGVHIVGTARWRWMVADETGWARCLEGCCEVQAKK